MIKIRQEITVNRPVHEVFQFMTEAGNIFKYSRATEEIRKLTPDPLGVGSRYEFISRFLGRRLPITLEVTEFEPDRRVSSRSEQGAFFLQSTTTFVEQPNGNTVISSESEIHPQGLWKLLEPILPGIIRRNSERDYERLREVLEQGMHDMDKSMDIVNISKTMVLVEH